MNFIKSQWIAASLTLAIAAMAPPAMAQVTFDGSFSWTQGGTVSTNTFNASGSDKLVMVVSGEHNFGGVFTGDIKNITYDGTALTKAVEQNPVVGVHQTASDIWYLDNPSAFHVNGTIQVTVEGNGNNYVHTAIGLSGTAPGVGSTATASGTASVSLTTTVPGSIVIFNLGMGGLGNTAGTATSVLPNAPDGATKISGLIAGSNWAGQVAARATIAAPSTHLFSFNTALADVTTVAAEFTPPVPRRYWDINGTEAGAGGPAATGIWDAATANWNPLATGTDPVAAWLPGATAVFAAGSDATAPYAVTVNGAQSIAGLVFEDGGVTLADGTSGSLSLSETAPFTVAPGLIAAIAVPIVEGTPASGLVKTGAGTLDLSGNLGFTGTTIVGAGTMVLSGNNVAATGGMALNGGVTRFVSPASINGSGRTIALNAGGAMAFSPAFGAANLPAALDRIVADSAGLVAADHYESTAFDFAAAGLTHAFLGALGAVEYTGTLTPADSHYRIGGGGGTLTMAQPNAITGADSSLSVRGDVVLAGANQHGGGTTFNGSTLALGDDASLGSGSLTVVNGKIFSANTTARTIANDIIFNTNPFLGNPVNNGKLTLTGAVGLGAVRNVTCDSEVEISGAIISGGVNKFGTGILTLSGNNTYTGATTCSAGTLVLSGTSTTSSVTVSGAGTILVIANPAALGSGTLNIASSTVQAVGTIVTTNAVSWTNSFTISGNGALTLGVMTPNGNHTLTNNNTTNPTTITAITAAANRNLTIAGTGNTTVTGAITTVAGTLTKNGAGTLTLQGTNTYTGNTTVNSGGCLALVGGSQASPISVANLALLGLAPAAATTSTKDLTLSPGAKIRIIGHPTAASHVLFTTTGKITGTPELETAIDGYSLVADETSITLVKDGGDYDDWAASFLPAVVGLPDADDDGDGLTNDQERIFGLDPTTGTSANPISVPFNPATGTLSFTRRDPALTGLIYKVWYSTNLVGWQWAEQAQFTPGPVTAGVQTVAVQLGAPLLAEPKLFVRISAEEPVPPEPLLAANFEDNDGGFSVATLGGTPWTHGTPNSPNQGGGAVTSGNGGSTKCWATNLSGGYLANTDTSLRSPIINLGGVTGATLTFACAIDAITGHTLTVNVLAADTDTVLANVIPATQDPNQDESPWQTIGPIALPAEAIGRSVRIEWHFTGNGNGTYNGVYIDDVVVIEAGP